MADDGKEPKDDPFADDDDDDDEEAPAEGEEEGSKKGVPMVGDVTLQDGRLFWAGLWADSEADLAAGKGKKFKYGGPEGQTAAALTQMPSGEWHGYFFNPGDEGGWQKDWRTAIWHVVSEDWRARWAPRAGGEGSASAPGDGWGDERLPTLARLTRTSAAQNAARQGGA